MLNDVTCFVVCLRQEDSCAEYDYAYKLIFSRIFGKMSKKNRGIRSKRSEEDMKSAVKLVLDDDRSEKNAAKSCGVPRQTLRLGILIESTR